MFTGAVMRNYVIFLVALSAVLIVTLEYNGPQGDQIVNCASCFSQKWEWSSWQCDVHCNVQKSPYGRCGFYQETIKTRNLWNIANTMINRYKWDGIPALFSSELRHQFDCHQITLTPPVSFRWKYFINFVLYRRNWCVFCWTAWWSGQLGDNNSWTNLQMGQNLSQRTK